MADKSNIEWTDATWNPIVGCSIKSPGCANCYAMPMAKRIEAMFAGTTGAPQYRDLTKTVKGKAVFTGKVALAPDHILTQPLRWKRGRKIFVNSMGDLFHENVPDEWIDKVFAVMALCPQHTFQVLTKRAERMRKYLATSFDDGKSFDRVVIEMMRYTDAGYPCRRESYERHGMPYRAPRSAADWWPLPNVWLGVSTERQQEADERIPHLLATPAAVRFISAEPLLGPIDLYSLRHSPDDYWPRWDALKGFKSNHKHTAKLDWVIVGGESGSGARPMHPDWVRSLRDQCDAADVPFFFKQWGEYRSWQPGDCGDVKHISARDGRCGLNPGFVDGERSPRSDTTPVARIGKKSAGRLLDGKEHNEFPIARAEAS